MGFMHQLHLLLWKNISLKRRGPWVLAFEIFIPLVLFFILLGLRQKKPAISVKEAFYSAAPLTSAGIIPIMQSLCPDGQRDEFGFLQYKNSTVTQLLERISEVVEQNRLFTTDRLGLGQKLENLQKHMDSLSSAPLPDDRTSNNSRGFILASVLKNQTFFQQFLINNLSLTDSTVSFLLNTPISVKEVHSLIFGTSSREEDQSRSQRDIRHSPEGKIHYLGEKLLEGVHSLDRGLINKALQDPSTVAHRQALLRLMARALGLSEEPGNQESDQRALKEAEGVLLTGTMLETITCGEGAKGELSKILLVPEKKRPVFQTYHGLLCSGAENQRSERFQQLSQLLKEQINTQSLTEKLHLKRPGSLALSPSHLGVLLKDVADMELLLKDMDLLSSLARLLPKGACARRTTSPTNSSWPLNTTMWGLNSTDISGEDGPEGAEGQQQQAGSGKDNTENPHSQFSAFVQLWAGLQPILCGNNRIIEPEALKQGNMSSLGFTSKEQRNLGLLVHLMTTNPKILYSPIDSEADKVIQKANETFAFVGNVTHYTRVWLNISAQLRTFLEEGRLHSHMVWLQQLSSELRQHPELLNGTQSELMQSLIEGNYSLPNTSALLEQLDTIDNAACGWTHFMSKVSVDVFKGFPDEDSIVNYTLNQAYQDNVSVFASVIFQTEKNGSLPPHVLYKIRQNSSFTEKTNEIRRAYWRPGPNTGGKFYFLYGFVWIQGLFCTLGQ